MIEVPGERWQLEGCPWIHGWNQEAWIVKRYEERRSMHFFVVGTKIPTWLADGLAVLVECEDYANRKQVNKMKALKAHYDKH